MPNDDGVLGRRQADRVITNLRLDAEDRARHVALDARASGTRGLVPGVLGQRRSNRRVTRRAQRVVGGRQLRVTIDVWEVRVVTRRAGRAALQEAAALPQADRVVREASRPAIRPVDRVLFLARRVFELGHEVVVVVLAGAVTGLHGVAERMALRAHHAARGRIESRRSDDGSAGGGGRSSRGLTRHVRAARAMTALAGRAEVHPCGSVGAGGGRVVIVLLTDMAPDAVLVPLLDRRAGLFIRADDVHIVEPLASLYIPTRRQDDDATALDGRQVMLNATAAERVIHAMLDWRARQRRLGDVELTVCGPQAVRFSVQRQPGLREITERGRWPSLAEASCCDGRESRRRACPRGTPRTRRLRRQPPAGGRLGRWCRSRPGRAEPRWPGPRLDSSGERSGPPQREQARGDEPGVGHGRTLKPIGGMSTSGVSVVNPVPALQLSSIVLRNLPRRGLVSALRADSARIAFRAAAASCPHRGCSSSRVVHCLVVGEVL